MAGVFQLEQSEGLEEIRRTIDILIDVLDDPALRELRRDMTTWVRRAILQARLPGEQIPELQDLQETQIMLAERVASWTEQVKAEGYEEGRHEGRKEGRKEGRTSGLLEGQRLALAAQAEEKFGDLEPRHANLLARASGDQLRQWLKEILAATTPDDLFRT